MQIKFLGAAGTVTGSRTLIHHGQTTVMIDCGLFQGPKPLRLMNWQTLPFANQVQAVFLTHAHLDHVGALPLLMRDGFSGPIICTSGTRDLAELILLDSGRLQEEDASYANRTGYSHHKPAKPLYTEEDAKKVLSQFKTIDRGEWFPFQDLKVRFRNAGHIVGASFLEIEYTNQNTLKRLVMSGDLGGNQSLIMKNREVPERADFLVLESTYGNKNLPNAHIFSEMRSFLSEILPNGRVLIPAFSVGRTQEVLHILGRLYEEGIIAKVPIFLNSPMATRATQIYRNHVEDIVPSSRPLMSPVLQDYFRIVSSVEESEDLVTDAESKIIVSASGMLTGGRVMHHLKEILPNPNDGLLFVGYQAQETKGRLLIDGIKELRIHHQTYPVKCRVQSVQSLSSHADQASLTQWVNQFCEPHTKVLLNHGEPDSLFGLKKHLQETLKLSVQIPSQGESVLLGT